jgi:hypothetical protein
VESEGVIIVIRNSDGEVNNTEKIFKIRYRNNKKFTLLVKVLELFLRCPIMVLAYKQELTR